MTEGIANIMYKVQIGEIKVHYEYNGKALCGVKDLQGGTNCVELVTCKSCISLIKGDEKCQRRLNLFSEN